MSGLFKKKKLQAVGKEDPVQQQDRNKPPAQLQPPPAGVAGDSSGSDSPRPFLLTSGYCHGARNPLDWATMPSSLQDKFPHWKESSVPSPLLPQRKSPERVKPSRIDPINKKMANGSSVPDHCIPYFVMNNDSLVSIALKFDTTTAAIAKVNKMPLLASHPIYPGDLLYIPDSEAALVTSSPSLEPKRDGDKSKDVEHADTSSPVPGDDEVNAESTEDLKEEFITKGRSSSLVEMQDEVTDDYVYVSSKFMSNQLCVHGYLVINRQSIMFKPNDEDPLVEDHGADPYEIWLPLQEIVYSYITKDYVSPSQTSSPLSNTTPLKKGQTSSDHDRHEVKPTDNDNNTDEKTSQGHDERTQNNDEVVDHTQNEHESQNENESHKEDEVPNNVDTVEQNENQDIENETQPSNDSHDVVPAPVLATEGSTSAGASPPLVGGVDRTEPECPSNYEPLTEDCNEPKTEPQTESQTEPQTESQTEPQTESQTEPQTKSQTEPQTESQTEPQTESQTEPQTESQTEPQTESQTEPQTESQTEPHGNDNQPQPTSTQPIYERRDTLSSLFQDSYERSYSSSGEESSCLPMAPSPWFFLYCRLSQSSQQTSSVSVVGMKIPVTAEQRGKRAATNVETVRTWFVFAIPKKRVDDIYSFIRKHHPLINEDVSSIEEIKLIKDRLEIINLKGSFSDDSLMISESHFLDPISSWEIFSVKDIQPPRIERMNVEEKLPLPLLIEPSKLLSNIHIRKLMPHLVSGAVGHDWYPIYSTFSHGFSLQTLYRNMTSYSDNPVLLVVQDSYGKLFGVMVPCPLRISDRFYGTGESFLFTFNGEDVSVFPWIGENDYVIKGSPDSIAFGSGDGFFGLWLDENLYHGSSLSCVTYGNSSLSTTPDYIIHGVEAWGFV